MEAIGLVTLWNLVLRDGQVAREGSEGCLRLGVASQVFVVRPFEEPPSVGRLAARAVVFQRPETVSRHRWIYLPGVGEDGRTVTTPDAVPPGWAPHLHRSPARGARVWHVFGRLFPVFVQSATMAASDDVPWVTPGFGQKVSGE